MSRENRRNGRDLLVPRAVSRFVDTQRPLESLSGGDVCSLAQLGIPRCGDTPPSRDGFYRSSAER